MENKAVYAKTIKAKPGKVTTTIVVDKSQKPERPLLRSLVEQIAGNPYFTRNWYYPQGWNFFPNQPDNRCVDYYFPYAEGGALLIDVLDKDENPTDYEAKAKAIRGAGHRYLILTPNMNENEARAELEAMK